MTMHKLVAIKILFMLWLEWVEQGTNESKYFNTWYGLCLSSGKLFKKPEILKELFKNERTPFNKCRLYSYEYDHKCMHLNPLRLQFVRDFLEEHKDLPVVISSKLYEDAVGVPYVKGVTNAKA